MIIIFKVNGKVDYLKLTISVLFAECIGFISSLFSANAAELYSSITLPSFAPPASVYGPVWTILYLLMGIASYRIWMYGIQDKKVQNALAVYIIQLALNLLWTIVFFTFINFWSAFLIIVVLLTFIIWTTILFYKIDKSAGYLMIPYIIWVAFATILNLLIDILNV